MSGDDKSFGITFERRVCVSRETRKGFWYPPECCLVLKMFCFEGWLGYGGCRSSILKLVGEGIILHIELLCYSQLLPFAP
jgi:hypothetical protein